MTALMVSCVVIVVAMVAAINLAIPALEAGRLHPSSTEMLWVVDAYVLVFGCLLIPAGAAGDRFGRKGALLTGLAVFAVGCLLSAAAPSIGVLVGGRALTGLGAALVMPATLSLLLQVTPRERKGQAVATWTAGTGAAGVVGNVGGGVVLEYLTWPWLFVSVALLITVLGLLTAWVAPRGERHSAALDPGGSAMLVAMVFALLFGIIEGPSRGWGSATVLGAFAVAIAVTAAFVRHGLRRGAPVLDPRVLTIPSLRIGVLGVAVTFFGLFALFFVNAQYLQYVKGYSPLVTGVAILPVAVTVTVVSRRSLVVAGRVGADRIVTVGLALVVVALGLLSLVGAGTPYLAYAGILVVAGTGLGLCLPALSTSIMVSLPARQAGMGSGLNGAAREIGSALGVAVLGTVMTSVFADRITTADGGSIERTLHAAAQVSPGAHAAAIDDFSAAMSAGYRVVGAVVLAAALAIGWGYRQRASRSIEFGE
ncbi:MAG TPA: MFS transporter [Baekduia sp.]|jgi:EmrB/QacA subfamily drug resistance transporter|nr:MFS transporter [Baekduia sp.]